MTTAELSKLVVKLRDSADLAARAAAQDESYVGLVRQLTALESEAGDLGRVAATNSPDLAKWPASDVQQVQKAVESMGEHVDEVMALCRVEKAR